MTSIAEIERQFTSVLNKAAENLNLKKYSLNLNLNAQKGDGFLGEMYKVSILDEETNNQIDLILKKAPTNHKRREQSSIEGAYKNEIRFYSVVYPALRKFEEDIGALKLFKSIPEYFASNETLGEEVLVFRDITSLGFELREKNLLLDDNHARLIFKTYGHYHAISFCLKKTKPKLFEELSETLFDYFKEMANGGFSTLLLTAIEKCFDVLDPKKDGGVRKKFEKYLKHGVDIFKETLEYKGKYFGILHGDRWSNNMMFKYQDGDHSKLEAMNLVDFQLVRVGTPVYDLSYFFYTGGSKDLFDKLEEYLDIYHASFSRCADDLGCEPEELLSREILTQDWKKYSKFGMLMAIVLTKIKLMSKQDSIDMIERSSKEETEELKNDKGKKAKKLMNMGGKEDNMLFNQRVRDILVHMYEIDAL